VLPESLFGRRQGINTYVQTNPNRMALLDHQTGPWFFPEGRDRIFSSNSEN
jgi:hypothetical protein